MLGKPWNQRNYQNFTIEEASCLFILCQKRKETSKRLVFNLALFCLICSYINFPDTLLSINADGELHVYEVAFDGNEGVEVVEVEAGLIEILSHMKLVYSPISGSKIDLPSDFCHGQQLNNDRVYFWCRRNILYCRKHGQKEVQEFPLKADVKCFDSVVYDGIIFCVAGCVNGNVYFLEIDVSICSN